MTTRARFLALLNIPPFPPTPTHPADRWEVDATLITSGNLAACVLADWLQKPQEIKDNISDQKAFVVSLARIAAASQDPIQIQHAVGNLLSNPEFGRAGLASLFAESKRLGHSLVEAAARLSRDSQRRLDLALEEAQRDATDTRQPLSVRCDAIDFLAVTDGGTELFVTLAREDLEQSVRLGAIAALVRMSDAQAWKQLFASFADASPAIQSAILDGAFANSEFTSLLLDEIAAGHIKPAQIDINHFNRLLQHRDKAIQTRAKELFAASIPQDRQKALNDYKSVLGMKSDALRGRNTFAKQCAMCHRIGDVGVNVAPDISDSREKTIEQLLTDILQPNRAIDSNYFSYTATTTDGVTHTGILTAETSTSITLKQPEGKTFTLRRDEIDELASSGVSLMPEGLERLIPPQDMADLLAYIKNWRYLDESPIEPAPVP